MMDINIGSIHLGIHLRFNPIHTDFNINLTMSVVDDDFILPPSAL